MSLKTFVDSETGHELMIDAGIPGQIGWDALVGMARVAKLVPKGGIIVETGSLFGRSSFVWSKNCDPTAKLFCIDPWVREQWIIDLVEIAQQPRMPFSLEAFRFYTRECTNITAIEGYSPDVVQASWCHMIDLYFDDSDHNDPGLTRNWSFWMKWVKPGGVFCGDDYGPHCPDVVNNSNQLAQRWSAKLSTSGNFWWLRRPCGGASGPA